MKNMRWSSVRCWIWDARDAPTFLPSSAHTVPAAHNTVVVFIRYAPVTHTHRHDRHDHVQFTQYSGDVFGLFDRIAVIKYRIWRIAMCACHASVNVMKRYELPAKWYTKLCVNAQRWAEKPMSPTKNHWMSQQREQIEQNRSYTTIYGDKESLDFLSFCVDTRESKNISHSL